MTITYDVTVNLGLKFDRSLSRVVTYLLPYFQPIKNLGLTPQTAASCEVKKPREDLRPERDNHVALKNRKRPTDKDMVDSAIWSADEELAPNSDTECEPLSKRHKHIEQIAQYCRDGGELYLLSVTLRAPITRNPWARRKSEVSVEKREAVQDAEGVRKRKRRVGKVAATTAKNGKVNQYFPAQKNSQEREMVQKKTSAEEYAGNSIVDTSKKDAIQTREKSPSPFKAVPRMIDFDQIPQSTDIPSQNFPSLQLIAPNQSAQPHSISPNCIDPNNEQHAQEVDDVIGLIDAPTPPGKTTLLKEPLVKPTSGQIESIRKLIGDVSQNKSSATQEDSGLFDDPTPRTISTSTPRIHSTSSDSLILPPSLTNHRSPPTFSPIKAGPLELSRLVEMNGLLNSESSIHKTSPNKSKHIRRRSSSQLDPPHPLRPPFQRSQTHNTLSKPSTPPLNTQSMLDQANQSFNAIVPPMTPSPSLLLPAAPLTSTKLPGGFTPFRELNASPVREAISFKLTEDSPLTYSPAGRPVTEDVLWGDIKEFLGTWNLDEEVSKYKQEADSTGKDGSQSQECLVEG